MIDLKGNMMISYLRRKPVPTRNAHCCKSPDRWWRFIPALAVGLTLLAGSVVPASGFAATIQGSMFNDLNGNGIKEQGESGLAHQMVYIRSHQTNQVATVTTDENGNFLSDELDAGTFILWTRPPKGWQQTDAVARTRSSRFYTVVLNEGDTHTVDFGVRNTTTPMISTDGPTVIELNTEATFSVDIVPDPLEPPVVIDTIVWTFGDGSPTANGQDVAYTYTSAGDYEVSVDVTDANGMSTATWKVLVNSPPTAIVATSSQTIYAGQSIDFEAAISDPDDPTLSETYTVKWDLEGVAPANTLTTSHTYTQPGAFEATFSVTDKHGSVSAVTPIEITVNAIFPPGSGDPCDSTGAISSTQAGNWSEATTWGGVNPATLTDVKVEHEINVDNSPISVDQLCVLVNGKLKGVGVVDIDIMANNIHNYGQIIGADGDNATGGTPNGGTSLITDRTSAKIGRDVRLSATTLLNESTGQIYAGRGGDDITYDDFTEEVIDATGVAGGGISLWGFSDIINHGRIGPKPINWWDHGISQTEDYKAYFSPSGPFNDDATGGNGGDVANAHIWKMRSDGGWNGTPTNYNAFNEGDAFGGSGGATILDSLQVLNTGRICSSNGGVAATWYEYGNAQGGGCVNPQGDPCDGTSNGQSGGWTWTPGTTQPTLLPGGTLTIGTTNITNSGMLCAGRGGDAWIEPNMLITSPNARIIGGRNLTLYGGDHFEMELSNLREGAITADETITLAVGEGGVIDLRGSAANVLKAGTKVEIFADTVLLDEGVTLEELIDAPSIVVKPSKIIFHAEITGPKQLDGKAGTTLPIKLTLLNSAAVADTYTLNVTDSAGWNLGTLPNTVTLDALKSTNLTLEVGLPNTDNNVNVITITASSQADSTVVATMQVQVDVELPIVVEPEKVTLTITQPANGTVSAEGIDCGEDCTEDYEVNSEVTLTATPNEGYNFVNWTGACIGTETCQVTMNEAKEVTANFEEVVACDSTTWLNDLIAKFKNDLNSNPLHSIYQYDYQGKTVFYVPPQCCDQYSTLYDACGNVMCAPDGGITGTGDGTCPDFFSARQNETVIFKQIGCIAKLSVTPTVQEVSSETGTTSFDVSTNECPIDWAATENDSWLTIDSGASGTNSGTITVNHATNSDDARTGEITVTADDAENSPQTVEVKQAADEICQAKLSVIPAYQKVPNRTGTTSFEIISTNDCQAEWAIEGSPTAIQPTFGTTPSQVTVQYTEIQCVTDPCGIDFSISSPNATNSPVIFTLQIDEIEAKVYTPFGIILDSSGNPIAGATVQIGDKTTLTDDSGSWAVDLTEGRYTVTAKKEGYHSESQSITLAGDNLNIEVNIEMNLSGCEAHAAYVVEEKLVSIPLLDLLLAPDNSSTQPPTARISVARVNLYLEGTEFIVDLNSFEVIEMASQFSECHAQYDEGALYLPYVDVVIVPGTVAGTYDATLRLIPPVPPLTFQLESYSLK
jgi:PKD repeat protein